MAQGMNMKRMRGRSHRGGGGGGPVRHQSGNVPMNRNHVFDSSGPDLRIRGTSQQLFEKYLQLGRDATSGGDRVMAESYFQYAEHYFRITSAMNLAQQAQQAGQGNQGGQASGHGGGQGNGQGGHHQGHNQPRRHDAMDADADPRDEDEPQQAADARPIAIAAGSPES
jgi:hypothetical protein